MRRRDRHTALSTALSAALLSVLAADADAQSVRGTVTRDGMRVEGAIVLLVDSTGRVAARGATQEHGVYGVTANRPGRYTIRVLRIGYAPTVVGPVRVALGAPTPLDVKLTGTAVRIAELRIVDRAPCQVRPDSGAVAFRLWEEARTALLATTLTQGEQLTMRTSTNQRMLDARGERVLADSSDVRTVATVKPFVSLSPDSLANAGYVQRNALGETLFWAPDADVLLSESFASSHCLRAERPAVDTGPAARWIGIAFLPSGAPRGVADVEGVLWLDGTSAELRRLDYRYVNVPDYAPLATRIGSGGTVAFLRLPSGGWIIPRWSIRYPVTRSVTSRSPASVIPGVRREAPGTSVELAGIRVTTGEVLEVRRGTRTIWERGRVGFRVRVIDDERALPAPGSVVAMDGAGDTRTTDGDGIALFPSVLPGVHRLAVRTAAMTMLGARPLEVGVVVPEQQQAPLAIAVASEVASLAQACGARVAARHESQLRGSLRTSALPVADTRVEASWQTRFRQLGADAPVVVPRRIVATTNARGEFVMCGLPRGLAISMRALRGRADDAPSTVTIPPAAVAAEHSMVVEP